jgi:hypothetical protein
MLFLRNGFNQARPYCLAHVSIVMIFSLKSTLGKNCLREMIVPREELFRHFLEKLDVPPFWIRGGGSKSTFLKTENDLEGER